MDKPWGLLVVPFEALRGMLDRTPGHGGAGTAFEWDRGQWLLETKARIGELTECRQAVVLRWEGQDLPHGWLAAWVAVGQATLPVVDETLLDDLREAGCTIIAVDEHGREVAGG